MKVQYNKDYPDDTVHPGFVFKKGWTAEHDTPTAEARINAGFCVEVHKDTRARRSEIITMQCATPVASK